MSSEREMNKAYWQFAGATLDSAAFASFRAGRNAAMKFMSSPRIPALTPAPAHPEPDQVAERFVGEPEINWLDKDLENMRRACEGHTPIPLVAFYTDAP